MYKTDPNPPALQPGFDFVPPANHAERLYRIARELATDEAGLIKQARDALKAYDAAIRGGEEDEAAAQRDRLDAIAERLPEDEEETGREHLRRLLAAAPGQVPLWGQAGGFVVIVGGCRVVIRSDGLSLHASAFDWDKPFLSETGYLELYDSEDMARGRTVKQCAIWLIRQRRTEWHRGKQQPRQLVPIVHYDWVLDEETRHNEKRAVTPAPDEADRDWQPGGWLYEFKNKR